MIWRSKLLSKFKKLEHGFVSKPYSFPFSFRFSYIPSYLYFSFLLKVPPNRWVIADQVHGKFIYVVKEHKSRIFPKIANKTDALITQERRRPLIMFFADCVPIFIYVPNAKIVGIVHSGWRGTIKDFPLDVLTFLKSFYDLSARDIYLAIGPSIRSCCFEVKEDFISQLPRDYHRFIIKNGNRKTYDLIGLISYQLERIGMLKENIDISDICTYCNNNFFSFIRDKTISRNIGFIYLK